MLDALRYVIVWNPLLLLGGHLPIPMLASLIYGESATAAAGALALANSTFLTTCLQRCLFWHCTVLNQVVSRRPWLCSSERCLCVGAQ